MHGRTKMYSDEEHLDNLVRHINLVRDGCLILGKRLISNGQRELGINLIARGFRHDVSKFNGIEGEYLHRGPDVPEEKLELAIHQHRASNDHHPEFWGGFDNMPDIAIAELSCDWYARAMEFASDLRGWIKDKAIDTYKIDVKGPKFQKLMEFVDLLLLNHFAKLEKPKRKKKAKVLA